MLKQRILTALLLLAVLQPGTAMAQPYAAFLVLNERFKELCDEWQLRS